MRILKKEYWPGMVVLPRSSSFDNKTFSKELGWCMENVGKGRYYLVDQYSQCTFYFRSEDDATFFALKWA